MCCQQRFYQLKDSIQEEMRKDCEFMLNEHTTERFGDGYCAKLRMKAWNLLEKPQSSNAARVIAFISMAFICLAALALTLNTIPGIYHYDPITNESIDNPYIYYVEVVCIAWFTFEYTARFWAAPNKLKFVKRPLNVIDVLAIMPFYVSLLFNESHMMSTEHIHDARRVVQVFRIMRVLRILKLARHSTGLQSLGFTLQNSYPEGTIKPSVHRRHATAHLHTFGNENSMKRLREAASEDKILFAEEEKDKYVKSIPLQRFPNSSNVSTPEQSNAMAWKDERMLNVPPTGNADAQNGKVPTRSRQLAAKVSQMFRNFKSLKNLREAMPGSGHQGQSSKESPRIQLAWQEELNA
ncbi:hypothetical protein D918_01014 [Trichuris suis]|nr:hypothetical protein D918_01014 [Trichuris suis]